MLNVYKVEINANELDELLEKLNKLDIPQEIKNKVLQSIENKISHEGACICPACKAMKSIDEIAIKEFETLPAEALDSILRKVKFALMVMSKPENAMTIAKTVLEKEKARLTSVLLDYFSASMGLQVLKSLENGGNQ